MELFEKRVDGEYKFEGRICRMRVDRAQLPDGKIVGREVVEHPGGVAVLPVDEDGICYLVKQYRYPMERVMLEVPAGKLEYGEEHRACAERELSEETGFTADRLIYLGGYASSPGFCDEVLHLYLATGLHRGEMHPDEDEYLNVERYSLDELLQMTDSGLIDDAKTVISILYADRIINRK